MRRGKKEAVTVMGRKGGERKADRERGGRGRLEGENMKEREERERQADSNQTLSTCTLSYSNSVSACLIQSRRDILKRDDHGQPEITQHAVSSNRPPQRLQGVIADSVLDAELYNKAGQLKTEMNSILIHIYEKYVFS